MRIGCSTAGQPLRTGEDISGLNRGWLRHRRRGLDQRLEQGSACGERTGGGGTCHMGGTCRVERPSGPSEGSAVGSQSAAMLSFIWLGRGKRVDLKPKL